MAERAIPAVDQIEQTARYAESLLALRTTKLLRRDGTCKAMQGRRGIVLVPEIESFLKGGCLLAQKEHKAPQRRAMEGALINRLLARRCEITDDASLRRHNLLVGQPIGFKILACERQQADTRVAAMREEKVGQVREDVAAACTAPAHHDYRDELNDQIDNDAHLATAKLMAGEAPVRFATTAPIEIPLAARKTVLVPLQKLRD